MNRIKTDSRLEKALATAAIDDIFHYKVSPHRHIDDYCRIRLYEPQNKYKVIIFTEFKNSGMSITNSIEKIIPQIKLLFESEGVNIPDDTIFIEHYDAQFNERGTDEFTRVELPEAGDETQVVEGVVYQHISSRDISWTLLSQAELIELLS